MIVVRGVEMRSDKTKTTKLSDHMVNDTNVSESPKKKYIERGRHSPAT